MKNLNFFKYLANAKFSAFNLIFKTQHKKQLAGTIVLSFFLCVMSFSSWSQGCMLSNSSSISSDDFRLYSALGNQQLDNYVATDVGVLRNFFNVHPSFFYFDDGDDPNAFAEANARLAAYPSGTVYFGKNLFKEEWRDANNITTVPIIIAHEFGHIVDYTYGAIPNNARSVQKELFADYMAGVFLRYRSSLIWTDINAALISFFDKGDYEFNSPTHHGTDSQRLAAIRAGYTWYGSHSGSSVSEMINADKNYLNIGRGAGAGSSGSVHVYTKPVKNYVYQGLETYYYTVEVRNDGDRDVQVTVGGLEYGYFQNCNTDNYITSGKFEEKTVHVSAQSSRDVVLRVQIQSSPGQCAGVPPAQKAKVIDVSDDN